MIYDSKAILTKDFEPTKQQWLDKGWEVIKESQGVTYLRRPYVDNP